MGNDRGVMFLLCLKLDKWNLNVLIRDNTDECSFLLLPRWPLFNSCQIAFEDEYNVRFWCVILKMAFSNSDHLEETHCCYFGNTSAKLQYNIKESNK